MTIPSADVGVKHCGRYRAVVHTGHTFDEAGNLIKEGAVLRETPWGENKITLGGFEAMLTTYGTIYIGMVAGLSNTAPAESDTTLGSYKGYTFEFVSQTRTINATPDGEGYVTCKLTYRFTFSPGQLGSGPMNIAEAGVVVRAGTPNATTPVLSRGLLVDGSGNPTAVPYNATDEYLDLYWEYTCYVPAEVTGVVSITVDGAPTNFNYTVRPMLFTTYWMNVSPNGYLPAWRFNVNNDNANPQFSSNASGNVPGDLNGQPSGAFSATNTPSITYGSYTSGSKARSLTFSWTPPQGNIAGGIATVCLSGTSAGGSDHTAKFQVGYSPKLPKDSDRVMSLNFTLSMANK